MNNATALLQNLDGLNAQQLKRLLVEHLTRQKLGLYWESNAIERDQALNAQVVLPRLVPEWSLGLDERAAQAEGAANLIIEGDNFDSLRLLKSTHAGRVRVIYIDPPYNTGNKDWVYNDHYVGANDRWRHSQWLEFLYRRLQLAKDLLTQDGVIMVSINDENRARLELLMDEVFPGRRIGSFVWRSRTGGNDAKGAFFSDNHEHVLVYGNSGFRFSGDEKSYSIYKHEEAGRIFYLSDLTKAHDFKERPNTFYPIQNPKDDVWYPCNPGRVWAYASKHRLKADQKLRGGTMEEMIEHGQVWFPPDQRIALFESIESLLKAVDEQDVPFSGSSPLLTRETPNLEEWVGRKIGYGRPRLKKFKDGLKNESQPISSWLTPRQESETIEASKNMPIVGTTEEGSRILKELMGDKAFPYPKPLSLIQGLLAQATRPGDIVLDFFAGSGTTGHAVLNLNAQEPDKPPRRFILCSSTEATAKEPDKNLCHDVCAERMRRVIASDPKLAHNRFAYLQLDKIAPGDAPFESDCAHAFQLLTLRLGKVARPVPPADRGVKIIIQSVEQGSMTVLVHRVTPAALDALAALPLAADPRFGSLRVYSSRPAAVREHLERAWAGSRRVVESVSLAKAMTQGQIAQGQMAPRAAPPPTAAATPEPTPTPSAEQGGAA
jgi:adenine-specific DNA-methyltransferase